jgi:hypothetical protein
MADVRRARQLIAAAIVCAAAPAHAQLCHPAADDLSSDEDGEAHPSMEMHHHMEGMDMTGMPSERPPITARADIEGDVASISMGQYVGFVPSVSIGWWRLEGRVAAPIYHLEYRGVRSDGPGDVLFSLSGTVLNARNARAGVALNVTEATGNAAVGLGMGDAMWMPGVWGSVASGRWGAVASASYGRMQDMGGGGGMHHHAAMIGSLVNPMNMEEVAGALRGTYRATRAMRVHVLGSIATPVDVTGVTRAYAAAGAQYKLSDWELGVEAALPLAGDPFHARMALDLARSF